MRTISQYLDELKEKTGSDYKSAEALKIRKPALSMIRKRGQMSDETAIKIAEELGIDATEVLIAAAIARSEGNVKNAWVSASKRFGIAAGLMLVVTLNWGISDSYASDNMLKSFNNLYIMRSKLVMRWFSFVMRLFNFFKKELEQWPPKRNQIFITSAGTV